MTDAAVPLEITPSEMRDLLAGPGADPGAGAGDAAFLIDCRTPAERALAALGPSIHIPMHETEGRAAEVAARAGGARVIVYCHHGIRSLLVARVLRAAGIAGAQSLRGGIDLWSREIDPAVPRY